MPLSALTRIFGKPETHPAQALAKRLERLLRDIEKPKITHPAKFWLAKEVQKATGPLLLTVAFEPTGEFAIVWAQNRQAYGVMLFAQSKWPTVDYDLWAYTRELYRGHNIAKLTLAEGIRQLALQRKDVVLTAEILIENERVRSGAVRWLRVLGFISSQESGENAYKRIFMAAYTNQLLSKALQSLPPEFQKPDRKISPLPPDLLSEFTANLTNSFSEGGKELLDQRRTSVG